MTTPSDAPDWRKMSRQELDRGLNNGDAVKNSEEIVVPRIAAPMLQRASVKCRSTAAGRNRNANSGVGKSIPPPQLR